MESAMPKYRPNVAFILQNAAGELLIGERGDLAGCWQFPQGGVKPGESLDQALAREVLEEICLPPDCYEVVRHLGPYRYEFANGRKKEGFDGQEQHYYLARLLGPPSLVFQHPLGEEFARIRWVRPEDYSLDWIAPMKRAVYAQVFRDFFSLELEKADKIKVFN